MVSIPPQPKALALPGELPEALSWRALAQADGYEVWGASIHSTHPASRFYHGWRQLPLATDDAFGPELARFISEQGIETVFTSHVVVWWRLKQLLPGLAPGVRLEGPSPQERSRAELEDLAQRVAEPPSLPEQTWQGNARPSLSKLERMALLKRAVQIQGQSSAEKIWALGHIARSSPIGDVVELGSLWGRSAFVLGWLARRHRLGNLLCVDPWQADKSRQADTASLNPIFEQLYQDHVFEQFVLNLLADFGSGVNYLRATSREAFAWYASASGGPRLSTPQFGPTQYEGQIAILHVDGGHDYAVVREDLASWGGLVKPGGWIVVDDYLWAHGQGPRRAGDEFLAEREDQITCRFVHDDSLYLRLKESAANRVRPALAKG